ncbi:MAG TPA: ATP-binding protein [Acidobacteriaceae bacterium]|nr:ATP-binding protein [Acidobacteriaceae bacterium]
MRGLFTKIFLSFWIAQSLTFVISTMLILRNHYPSFGQFQDFQDTTLQNEGSAAADIYEKSGCAGLKQYAASLQQTIYLADLSQRFLCPLSDTLLYREALAKTFQGTGAVSTRAGAEYLWSTTVRSASGRRYLFLLSRPFQPRKSSALRDLERFASPQVPVGIVVYGATTFFLVMLLTRPIARLRAAARGLAQGKLETRVSKPDTGSIFGGDEIQGLAQDFNHMAERLESLVAAQNMLLRDVSHELRSPLARLSVALELAREEAPERMLTQLQRIEREAGRLNLLIGDLLRLSSMEATEAPLGTEEFSLNTLIEGMLADAEFEAQQRSCTVRLQSSCHCIVRGNAELVYRAIENVVRNAIRYTREGSVVEIELNSESLAGVQMAVVAVKDQGPGVPENELKNIFRPFYRIDNARQRNTGGFGVGLALTERAVRLHHGEVRAQNRGSEGFVVTLRIPAEKIEVQAPVRAV